MFETDTICAVSTAPGQGGIGIIRVSGRDAIEISSQVFRSRTGLALADAMTHTIHYGHVIDAAGEIIDEALVSIMRAPRTYTRDDVVEINCHGGMMPLWRTVAVLVASGARQAEPGEFTKRAFLNGRIDLTQAEAVMDIISARTERAHQAANEQLLGGLSKEVTTLRDRLIGIIASVEAGIDFPEEDIETQSGGPLVREIAALTEDVALLQSSFAAGRILREGFATAIVGKPNVGKSSLLNALLKQDRAIVTDIPGTTRDIIEEFLNIDGVPIRIVDTAGIRHSHDVVEQEGVRRSHAAIESADIVLVVLDSSEPLSDEDQQVLKGIADKKAVLVLNKADKSRKLEPLALPHQQVSLSCKTGEGLLSLKNAIAAMAKQGMVMPKEHAWVVNQRHVFALNQAKASLDKALESASATQSPEFIAVDLRGALDSLGLIIGATYTDDILERIFNEFCIGK
jgi:tRNA modification GTPase